MATENKIEDYRNQVIEKMCIDLDELLLQTQSPIEQLFLLSFLLQPDEFKIIHNGVEEAGKIIGLKYSARTYWYGEEVGIIPQAQIEKFLTVDFLINVAGRIIIVECDGHDFHEKTKEQSKRDKQRDRKLAKYGYTILRFSGSEIYQNPHKCIQEVEDFIINILQEMKDKK